MFSNRDIWDALDHIAQAHSTSPSGLAKQAGLDPTTFNRSKRKTNTGKDRWLSTESLSKVLAVIGMSFEEFAILAENKLYNERSVPLIGLAQAGDAGFFDDAGFPVGSGWDEVTMPNVKDNQIYALEIVGESMLPVLRPGDRILVSPNQSVQRGDRVVVKTIDGEIMAKEFRRMTQRQVELLSLNPTYDDRMLELSDIQWIARIIWVSQ